MKKVVLLLFCMCLVVGGCSTNHYEADNKDESIEITAISTEKVKNIVDNIDEYEDVKIIDVRNKEEYKDGHIEGAINIPLLYIDKINELVIPKDKKIIVYCRSGRRSSEAAKILVEMGYENIFDMGGIENWEYELVEGADEKVCYEDSTED